MAEDEDDDNSNRRVGKKKYYPFGTPSHLHHAYSEFAHIAVDNRDFAIQLATATGIKAEVVVEEKPKKARRVPIAKKKAAPAVGEEESVGSATVDEPEEAACTKIACVMIMRALNDMEYRNEVERLDLEDEYEHHVAELRVAEQDLAVAEGRLDKVNDIGNQLEMSADQMILKVETLEKTKEALKVEHNEINSKLMHLEVERQKCNRKLEKALKALADARWRKKKASQPTDQAELASSISEGHILQADASTVASVKDVFVTPYARLAQGSVVDTSERAPTLQTVVPAAQETYFHHPDKLDKYAKAHYHRTIKHSIASWQGLDGSTLACSLSTASAAAAASREEQERRVLEEDSIATRRSHRLATQAGSGSSVMSAAASRVESRLLSKSGSVASSRSVTSLPSHRHRGLEIVQSVHSLFERSAAAGLVPVRSLAGLHLGSLASPRSSDLQGGSVGSPTESLEGISVLSADMDDAYLDQLADSGIYIDPSGRRPARLDGVFYSDPARASFGRRIPLGKVRTMHPRVLEKIKEPPPEDESVAQRLQRARHKPGSRGKMDLRNLPKLTSQVLTTKHPGMRSFAAAATLSMTT